MVTITDSKTTSQEVEYNLNKINHLVNYEQLTSHQLRASQKCEPCRSINTILKKTVLLLFGKCYLHQSK